MRREQIMAPLLSVAILSAAALTNVIGRQPPKSTQLMTATLGSEQACSADKEISRAVAVLPIGSYEEQQKSVAFLKVSAEGSTVCRKQVITTLLVAMDQRDLNITSGTPHFFVWHYGTRLLGELKAVEALDFLIANFHLHDGSGFPLNHYPALGAVIDMGEVALPKLQVELKENPDRYTRRHTVFCIAQIGGQSAEQILKQALPNESDPCTASCIRATLESFTNKRRPHHISDEGRTKWYSTFLCNGK